MYAVYDQLPVVLKGLAWGLGAYLTLCAVVIGFMAVVYLASTIK